MSDRFNKKKKKTVKRSRLSNAMVFILVFILFLVVFGLICIWMAIQINKQALEGTSPAETSEPSAVFNAGDARSLLVVVSDGGQADSFTVIRIDPMHESVLAMAFPPDTVVDADGGSATLNTLYRDRGIAAARTALAQLSGLEMHNYAVLSYNNIYNIVTAFEPSLIYTLKEDVTIDGKIMRASKSTYAASQVTDLLKYTGWSGGRRERAKVHAEIIAAFIDQYMVTARAAAGKDFSLLINNISQTDVLISHYERVRAGIAFLAEKNTSGICRVAEAPGGYSGSGEELRFYTDEDLKHTIAEWIDGRG